VRCALSNYRDRVIDEEQRLASTGVDTKVARLVRTIAQRDHDRILERSAAMHQETLAQISHLWTMMSRVVEGYQQLRMQQGMDRDSDLDKRSEREPT
jgi:hypothetical protein